MSRFDGSGAPRINPTLPAQAVFEGRNLVIIPLSLALAKGECLSQHFCYPELSRMDSLRECNARNVCLPPIHVHGADPRTSRLNIRRDLSERLVAPGASGLFVGSLTFFHCALRQSERSEGDAQVLEGCGQVTLAREV